MDTSTDNAERASLALPGRSYDGGPKMLIQLVQIRDNRNIRGQRIFICCVLRSPLRRQNLGKSRHETTTSCRPARSGCACLAALHYHMAIRSYCKPQSAASAPSRPGSCLAWLPVTSSHAAISHLPAPAVHPTTDTLSIPRLALALSANALATHSG